MMGVAGQRPELSNLLSRGLKKIRPLSDGGADRARACLEPPTTCFLTGVWRATVLLGPTPAAINPLMALCVPTHPDPSSLPSLRLRSAVSLALPFSPSLFLSPRRRSTPHPANFIPTRMPSVTILLYFPCTLRRSSFFRQRCSSPSLFLIVPFSSNFGFPSYSS